MSTILPVQDEEVPGKARRRRKSDANGQEEIRLVQQSTIATDTSIAKTRTTSNRLSEETVLGHLGLPFHPVTALFDPLQGQEFEDFKNDIRVRGLLVPIWTHQGKIIDGRNRYRACQELGIEPKFQEWDGCGSLVAFVLSLNERRRHLNESQRAMAAARAKPMFEAEARQRMLAGKAVDPPPNEEEGSTGEAATQAAKVLHVGRDSVYKAQKVLRQGAPELQRAVSSGKMSVAAASKLTALSPEEQVKAMAEGKKAVIAKAKAIRESKKKPPTPANAKIVVGTVQADGKAVLGQPKTVQPKLVEILKSITRFFDRLALDLEDLNDHDNAPQVDEALMAGLAKARTALVKSTPSVADIVDHQGDSPHSKRNRR